MFNFINNWQTVVQSSSSMLISHLKCLRVLVTFSLLGIVRVGFLIYFRHLIKSVVVYYYGLIWFFLIVMGVAVYSWTYLLRVFFGEVSVQIICPLNIFTGVFFFLTLDINLFSDVTCKYFSQVSNIIYIIIMLTYYVYVYTLLMTIEKLMKSPKILGIWAVFAHNYWS